LDFDRILGVALADVEVLVDVFATGFGLVAVLVAAFVAVFFAVAI